MAVAAEKRILDGINVQDLDRLYREAGVAALCEDGQAVKLFKEEE